MLAPRIYSDPIDVDNRLKELFGTSRSELMRVVHAVVAARGASVSDDPISAPGLLAYIYGTRELRAIFKRKKWTAERENNVEAVQHPVKKLRLVYQSVDIATSALHPPQAISGKGSGAGRIIDSAQGLLFSREELETRKTVSVSPADSGVWFLCVSVDGEDVNAELSLPASIEDGNFRDFIERIYILDGGDWTAAKAVPVEGEAVEFEPVITRRS